MIAMVMVALVMPLRKKKQNFIFMIARVTASAGNRSENHILKHWIILKEKVGHNLSRCPVELTLHWPISILFSFCFIIVNYHHPITLSIRIAKIIIVLLLIHIIHQLSIIFISNNDY